MESKTSTGLDQNIAGLLCYLLGWITGIIFLLIEKDNRFVRFHAVQSIIVFGGVTVISIVISILSGMIWAIGGPFGVLSVLLGAISTIIWLIALILWIVLMVKAYQNEYFKLPVVGDMAEQQLG